MNYHDFLSSKHRVVGNAGKAVLIDATHPKLFEWQKAITLWAIKKGRAAIFLDTGLGKTFLQLEWARLMGENTLIIAPLSVARQTVREARKIDIEVRYVRSQSEITDEHKMWITNYEMAESFDFSRFGSVVLDESSILKAIDGKTRKRLTELCSHTPYRLCCTATPAPNDWTEIGNHAEFLGICTIPEMLATFFINANKEHQIAYGSETYRKKGSNKGGTEWRIKHHAESHFFEWLASWAVTMTKPSDLGYDDNGFILPPLNILPQFVETKYTGDQLFFTKLHGISDRADTRKATLQKRLDALRVTIGNSDDQWIIWAGLDSESKGAKAAFPEAVEVSGSDSPDYKAESFEQFQDGKFRILITKAKIGGFGMNFQNAHNMAFLGLNDSWESFYQAVRREWRYGQTLPVNVHVIMSDVEAEVYQNVMRKDVLAKKLRTKLIDQIRTFEQRELGMQSTLETDYAENTVRGNGYTAMLGDSCQRLTEIAENSIDLSVYSPPFADLFTYTASERDLGNSRGWGEFFSHYRFIIEQVLRVTKPGRLTCVHTSDIPAIAQKDGYIGVKDFPGAVIREYEAGGWTFIGRCFVQKNPQAQAIRVKSKALLFVQMRKDSADSRPALVDQVLLFKKPGENAVPITPVDNGELDNETWIEWAHGIWLGIRETETLQVARARGADDEKHICPLQLGTIERCIKLYSNPGEMVLTPFGGIGSEAYMALTLGRKATLIELKPEYFKVAVGNMDKAVGTRQAQNLFMNAGVLV
jgi:DNA modification methylase/superfamily II DNA or RNA helicase